MLPENKLELTTMKPQEVLVRAPGSFILVGGSVEVDAPAFEDGPVRLWSNEYCVCVGTRSEVDGDTHLIAGSNVDHSNLKLAFTGEIATDSHRLVVSDAELNVLIEVNVPSRRTALSIWTNAPREPTLIAINITER